LQQEDVAEVVVEVRGTRGGGDCSLKRRHGFVISPLLGVEYAEPVLRIRMTRLQLQRSPICRDRVGIATLALVKPPDAVEGIRIRYGVLDIKYGLDNPRLIPRV
jgi:hypothetical protein